MDSDTILPSPNGMLPAEIVIQIVEDYFAFRNAEVEARRDKIERQHNAGSISSARRRESRRLEKTPKWSSRYDNP
jgi:hypothetical protein